MHDHSLLVFTLSRLCPAAHCSSARFGLLVGQEVLACQLISFIAVLREDFGRGEWIRTTDLLVPNQAL